MLLLSLLSALFITMALIPLLMQYAGRFKLVDVATSDRKVHTGAIPPVGGIAMACGTMLPLAVLGVVAAGSSREEVALLVGMVLMVVLGVADDRFDLDYRLRLIAQLGGAALLTFAGGVVILSTSLPGLESLWWPVGAALTIFGIVAVTNAINLADGLDGLAGGMVLMIIATVGLLAFHQRNYDVLLVCATLIGSVIGFLRFNTHPARIFMGDGGSYFLGFTAVSVAIMLTLPAPEVARSPYSAALPLLLFGLPIFDTLMVMTTRLRQGRSPFAAGRDHTHHRLLGLGLQHGEAVMVVYVLQFVFVLSGYLLRSAADAVIIGTFCGLSAAIVLGHDLLRRWGIAGSDFIRSFFGASTMLAELGVNRAAHWGVVFGVHLYLLFCAFMAPGLTSDIWILVVVMTALQALFLIRNRDAAFSWFERLVFYLVAVVALFVSQVSEALPRALSPFDAAYFVVLAVMIVLTMRSIGSDRFQTNPLDILVLLIAVTLPNLPELGMQPYGVAIIKLIMLFYGIEFIISINRRYLLFIRLALFATLVLLAFKGVIS